MSFPRRSRAEQAPNVLIQTLIAPKVATWLRRKAAAEGISVAAYVRRMLIQARDVDELDGGGR